MKAYRAARAMTMVGNIFIALSLLSGLLWWRASLALFFACAVAIGVAQALRAYATVNGSTPDR